MNIVREIIKLWNNNFNKGVTIFQMFLMGCMFIGVFFDSSQTVLFSMFSCLIIGYLEPNQERFYINIKSPQKQEKK